MSVSVLLAATSVACEINTGLAPMELLALTISFVAHRSHPGMSGILLLVLGAVSALGAVTLLVLGLGKGAAPVVVIGLRHLVVATYAWAAIAKEPPPRRRYVLRPIRV